MTRVGEGRNSQMQTLGVRRRGDLPYERVWQNRHDLSTLGWGMFKTHTASVGGDELETTPKQWNDTRQIGSDPQKGSESRVNVYKMFELVS